MAIRNNEGPNVAGTYVLQIYNESSKDVSLAQYIRDNIQTIAETMCCNHSDPNKWVEYRKALLKDVIGAVSKTLASNETVILIVNVIPHLVDIVNVNIIEIDHPHEDEIIVIE